MYASGTVWLWGPVLCLGRIFVGSAPGVGFLFFGTKYYCVCGLRPFGSGSRFWSYTVRDHLALKEKQGVDVVTAALTSVRNVLQKPETVYDLRRLLLRHPDYFQAGSLHNHVDFWEDLIFLTGYACPQVTLFATDNPRGSEA